MTINGVELCVDAIGDRRDPAILLIGGAGTAMDWWEGRVTSSVNGSRRAAGT